MANEQREFWSTVAQNYDQVVDLQIGPLTRSMVRERVGKEGRLGKLAPFHRTGKDAPYPEARRCIAYLEPGPGCTEWCGPHPLPDSNCVPRD